jgi:UrcA family protein
MKTFALLIAVGTLVAPAVYAASNFEPVSETVHFADLTVASPEGAAMLYKRIGSAARDVCRELDAANDLDLAIVQRHKACVHDAIASAVERVGAPELSGYAASRGITTPQATLARNP